MKTLHDKEKGKKIGQEAVFEHDWGYDRGFRPTYRKCLFCHRTEYRDISGTSDADIAFSNWYVKL